MNSLTQNACIAQLLDTNVDLHLPVLVLKAGKWKTREAYAMRRISVLKDENGGIAGFRPMIQQGRGQTRKTHSEVFRITDKVDASMAFEMAQRWRDRKEAELGISGGQLSRKSACRFVPGISLVVSSKAPYRAYWKWSQKGHKKLTVYMGSQKSYVKSYETLIARICEYLGCPPPSSHTPPRPSAEQRARLAQMGITGLPKGEIVPP